MRPVFIRELKELSPALVPVLAFAVIAGASFAGPLSVQFDDILAVASVGGVFLGCLHGGLDRWRRGDLFALHRAVPAVRMEAARTLAGVVVLLLGIVALVITHRVTTLSHLADLRAMPQLAVAGRTYDHLGAGEIALLAGFVLAGWAVLRFAVGAVRIRWALPAFVVLPLASWSFLSRTETFAAATALALALTMLFSLGTGLCLAGDRR
ncbi:MAG: hypothetical protein L6Q95_11725 [Planctomycetes bacterium]|nr:hypothetical protein [Planctomycetota bacterium]